MKKLTIIIPVFNEKNTVATLIERVRTAGTGEYTKQIIIVDDGSNDGTEAVLRGIAGEDITLIRHEKNKGKGSAVRTALERTTGELTIIQDADLEYDPGEYKNIILAYAAGHPIVYGSRNLKKTGRGYFFAYIGGRFLTALANTLFGSRLTDINTGYKLFETGILKQLGIRADRFDFCEEVTAKALRAGYPITEIPISYTPRTFSEGNKIRAMDGVRGIWMLVRTKLGK